METDPGGFQVERPSSSNSKGKAKGTWTRQKSPRLFMVCHICQSYIFCEKHQLEADAQEGNARSKRRVQASLADLGVGLIEMKYHEVSGVFFDLF